MKKIIIFIFLLIFFSPIKSFSLEIKFLNTEILGKATSAQINLFETSIDFEIDLINPKIVQLDIKDGLYSASSVFYDADKINFNELVKQIDKKYPNTKNDNLSSINFATWRVEDKQFSIFLDSSQEDGMLRVMYVKFVKKEKIVETAIDIIEIIEKNCNNEQ